VLIETRRRSFHCRLLHWFSMEVGGLPEVFTGINENVISAAVEGTLVMAGPFVNLGALQAATAVSEAGILPMDWDVRRAAHTVSRKWWRSFGYGHILSAIRAKLREVTGDV
jgi:hypothetical protein